MKLFYREYGSGPPLIILHGLLGSGGNWHTLSRSVFSKRYHVFAIDQRNHGASPHSDRIDYPAMAADLGQFLDERGYDSCSLLGHSMGGKTAMRFAMQQPARVDRLVVVDIAPRASGETHRDLLEALAEVDLSTITRRTEVQNQLASRIDSADVVQFLLQNLKYELYKSAVDGSGPKGRYVWRMNLEAIVANYVALREAMPVDGVFDKPTLFVRGALSNYIRGDDESEILRLFPQAEVVTVKGAGHWVHADQPSAFAEVVMTFLDGRAAASRFVL